MSNPLINTQKVLADTYENIGKLSFGDLILLNLQLTEHIHNCWQQHQIQIEKTKQATLLNDKQPLPDTSH